MASDFWTIHQIMRHLQNEEATAAVMDTTDDRELSTDEQNDEQEAENNQEGNTDRRYLFIIFNDPTWSRTVQRLKGNPTQQRMQTVTSDAAATVVNEERRGSSVDEQFTLQLRQLFDDYMQRTRRRFPIRYFIDFTNQTM
ncbi:unnamed protein product [Adineta ricciae]|uniref:Uncharacterized protein n=1 Tax=Adineta ricciae TaxID=249248 RepID=A0A815UJ62_ADIRI|nr:unnamed protein product [Adineta ricciae]CAF1679427.1 unnamed protein product [Adineta ricciae]